MAWSDPAGPEWLFVDHMNPALLDKYLRASGRDSGYARPEEIERDLDRVLEFYEV